MPINENFNNFDFQLSTEDMYLIVALDTGKSIFFDHAKPEIVK
jgi:2,5-diketo-D-gluconate reductase A